MFRWRRLSLLLALGGPAGCTEDTAEEPTPCALYAQKYADCYGDEFLESAEVDCEQVMEVHRNLGTECLHAVEALYTCQSRLSCLQFPGPELFCPDASEEFELQCESGD